MVVLPPMEPLVVKGPLFFASTFAKPQPPLTHKVKRMQANTIKQQMIAVTQYLIILKQTRHNAVSKG